MAGRCGCAEGPSITITTAACAADGRQFFFACSAAPRPSLEFAVGELLFVRRRCRGESRGKASDGETDSAGPPTWLAGWIIMQDSIRSSYLLKIPMEELLLVGPASIPFVRAAAATTTTTPALPSC